MYLRIVTRAALFNRIKEKKTYLCVGLDADLEKIPPRLRDDPDPLFAFNKHIIDATHDCCVAYKINVAFYEAIGAAGWESLRKTVAYIPEGILTVADAKRGDIANTSAQYAKAFFDRLHFDAITLSPYMGRDSITPFLRHGKWAIVLAYTSNTGADDFQSLPLRTGIPLYEQVVSAVRQWASPDQLMYVVGATRAEEMKALRALAPDHFFLMPGIGAQGGSLETISRWGMNAQCGLLVNVSRSLIYASSGLDFADKAGQKARILQRQMARLLERYL